jgi:hypothetical protein
LRQQSLFDAAPPAPSVVRATRQPVVNAHDRKASGQQLAANKAGQRWRLQALSALAVYLSYLRDLSGRHSAPTFTFDAFRSWSEINGRLAPPNSLNAWGALPAAAVRIGLCTDTGRAVQAQRELSHARLVKLWMAAP